MSTRLIALFLCILTFAPIANADSKSNAIKLGAILALTGDMAPQNNAFLEGIELGLKEINDKGGIRSSTVKLAVEDSSLIPKNSNTAARKLLSIDTIDGVILGSVVEAMASGPAFENAKIPALVLWDASKEIDDLGDYIFSVGIWSESSGWVAAKYALTKGRKAAILAGLEPWSETLAKSFAEKFIAAGGKIVAEQKVDITTSDFRTSIAQIRSQHPQVLYAPFCYNLITLFRQLREARLDKVQIITSDCIAEAHLREAPGVFDNVVETASPILSSIGFQQILTSYEAYKGYKPAYPFFVALGYDATRLFAKAWNEVGTDGSSVKNWLYNMPPFKGSAGDIRFNARGSSSKIPGLFRVSKNRFEALE